MNNIDESYNAYYTGPPSDHFDGTKFFNPWNPRPKKGFRDMLKWRMEGNRAEWPESVKNEPRPPLLPAVHHGLRATYIGHAASLIQTQGLNILTDPFFSDRASPFASIGPKRVRPPFVSLNMLPKIDYVFISHNHYDHMDLASILWLAAHHKPVFITPLGNGRLLKSCGCNIVSLDWDQQTQLNDKTTFALTPSQHWSRRGWSDTNRDLWGGCVIKNEKTLYFAGDTGFDESLFAGIHKNHGAADLALIPIGAYEPRWFMQYAHMNPDDAVKAHKLLNSRQSMGLHFETLQLTDEAFDAPRKDLAAALEKQKIDPHHFIAPHPGDFIET